MVQHNKDCSHSKSMLTGYFPGIDLGAYDRALKGEANYLTTEMVPTIDTVKTLSWISDLIKD